MDIKDIRTYRDLSKTSIIELFVNLAKEASAWDETADEGSVLAIMVHWIGWSLSPDQLANRLGLTYMQRIVKHLVYAGEEY